MILRTEFVLHRTFGTECMLLVIHGKYVMKSVTPDIAFILYAICDLGWILRNVASCHPFFQESARQMHLTTLKMCGTRLYSPSLQSLRNSGQTWRVVSLIQLSTSYLRINHLPISHLHSVRIVCVCFPLFHLLHVIEEDRPTPVISDSV